MTYDFRCLKEDCGNFKGFTVEKSIKDETLRECPICKGEIVQIFSKANVGLNFKGSFNSTR